MIPKIAVGIPVNSRASGTDRSPNDRLVMAKARDYFLLRSVCAEA